MKVRYRRRAQLDIDNIHDYISERNPRAATEVVAASVTPLIASAFGRIWDMSVACPKLMSGASSACPASSYTKLTNPADEVAIIAVFHGAQDRDAP